MREIKIRLHKTKRTKGGLMEWCGSNRMAKYIHCRICHDACLRGVVRHDSEKIPDEVKASW
ncbi:MAG: hypothetical protein J7J10_01370 [Deltaproteobacteria bacterium]|nr:hypothetical protein [Deltaproteobacteria bacterium]